MHYRTKASEGGGCLVGFRIVWSSLKWLFYSLIRSIIKKHQPPDSILQALLKPTHLYTLPILELIKKINVKGMAHITGGGLIENLLRSVPANLSINIDLSKIRIERIFKWIKKKNVSDSEMMQTFNCGVGFCVILPRKNIQKVNKFFSKKYKPYEIGHISKGIKKINIVNYLKW